MKAHLLNLWRRGKLRAPRHATPRHQCPACEPLEGRLLLSATVAAQTLAPTTLAGYTVVCLATASSTALPSLYQFTIPATGTGYNWTNLLNVYNYGAGTYTYTRSTGTVAALSLLVSPTGSVTDTLTFTTATAGTYHSSGATSFQDGSFVLTTPNPQTLAPTTMANGSLLATITGGGGQFAAAGSFRILPGTAGNTYTLQAVTGTLTNASGTCNLIQVGPQSVNFTYLTSTTGGAPQDQLFLAFSTTTTGVFYHAIVGVSGYQTGTFALASAATHQRDAAYVTQLYADLLHRTLDPTAQWVDMLDFNHATFADVATGITSSTEYDADIVQGFYTTYLGRQADANGLNDWVAQMQQGYNAESIRASILASAEYFQDVGATNTKFVTALYQDYLNRQPDPGGLASWTALLTSGQNSRLVVTTRIASSDENYTLIITGYYRTYLHRAADPGGLAAWKTLLAGGLTQPQIITSFVTSAEYLALYNLT